MSSNRRRKQRQNPLIIGDTTIPQTGKKMTKNADQNLAVCCGAIWLLVRKILFIPIRFLDYLYEFWHLLSALGSDVRKKLYTCTSTFSALNCCSGIFFKSLSYLYEVVRKTFPPIFELFETFDRNFANLVAPPSDKNENYVVRLNEQSLPKKKLKTASKSAYKHQRTACSNYAPLERTARRPRSVTKNKQTNTIFSHLQPGRVSRSSPNFAWWWSSSCLSKR